MQSTNTKRAVAYRERSFGFPIRGTAIAVFDCTAGFYESYLLETGRGLLHTVMVAAVDALAVADRHREVEDRDRGPRGGSAG
jgi:hypothetical protein